MKRITQYAERTRLVGPDRARSQETKPHVRHIGRGPRPEAGENPEEINYFYWKFIYKFFYRYLSKFIKKSTLEYKLFIFLHEIDDQIKTRILSTFVLI